MSRPRARRPALLGAAALALAGALGLLASTAFDGSRGPASPAGVTPVDAGSRDQGDISSNNSPTLTQNPRRPASLAIVNRVDAPAYTCRLHVSSDRGRQWSSTQLPIPRGEQDKCFAPDAAFAADGTLYVSFVTLRGAGNEPHALWLTHSTDGGRTLAAPRRVSGRHAFQARLATDPQRPQRVYLTWLQPEEIGLYLFTGSDNRIVVARSDDGGRSFGRPVPASDQLRQRVLAPSAVVGPGDELYVLFLDVGGDRLDYEGGHGTNGGPPYSGTFALVLGRSTDGGRTWQESLVDDQIVPTRRFIAFLPPFPSLAVDPRSGRVYVAFEDARDGSPDVQLWSLARGERDWRGPTRVNDTPDGDRSTQYMPKVAVAPDGRVDVAYYDRRADARDRRNHVAAQSSTDAGRTFSAHANLTDRSFDSRIGTGSERGLPDIGSRIGLVSDPAAVLGAWTDTRAGTVDSSKQDIAFAEAAIARSGGLADSARSGLRYGTIALLLAALALLLVSANRRDASSA